MTGQRAPSGHTHCTPGSRDGDVIVQTLRGPASVDPCVAWLVEALNNAGVETTNSCCGHGRHPGSVILRDYSRVYVCSQEESEVVDAAFPNDIHGDAVALQQHERTVEASEGMLERAKAAVQRLREESAPEGDRVDKLRQLFEPQPGDMFDAKLNGGSR